MVLSKPDRIVRHRRVYVDLKGLIINVLLRQVGDKLSEIVLFEGTPGGAVNLTDVFKGKKGVLFGVPGAFTPGCSKVVILLSPLSRTHKHTCTHAPTC